VYHVLLIIGKWLVAGAVLGGLAVGAFFVHRQMEENRRQEATGDQVPSPTSFQGQAIKLNAKLADSYGVAVEPVREASWQERVVVYGRVVPNPRATYEVRAPFAGTVQAVEGLAWPAPGQVVRAGQSLARIVLRVGPQERFDFQAKLDEARQKRKGAEQVCKLRQEAFDRLTKSKSAGVPQRELDDAQAQLIEAQTQLASARAAEDLWQQCLNEIDSPAVKAAGAWSKALTVPEEKGRPMQLEVAELAAQPGTAVEAGGLIARLVDCSRALVRLDLPAEVLQSGPPPRHIELTTDPRSAAVPATYVGPAPLVDAPSQLSGYYYLVETARPADGTQAPSPGHETAKAEQACWRPGLFVQAQLPVGNESRSVLAVPAGAILHHQGRSLVYVRTQPNLYERREVQVLGYEGDRCLLAPLDILLEDNQLNFGVKAGEQVVSSQAQVLLSTEFRRDADD
jgi:biotin carboxyl carrier protein